MLDQSGLLVLIAAQPLQHFQRQTLLAERGIDLVQRAIDHVLVLVLDVNIEADQPHPHPGIERAAILRAFLHPFDQARQAADALEAGRQHLLALLVEPVLRARRTVHRGALAEGMLVGVFRAATIGFLRFTGRTNPREIGPAREEAANLLLHKTAWWRTQSLSNRSHKSKFPGNREKYREIL